MRIKTAPERDFQSIIFLQKSHFGISVSAPMTIPEPDLDAVDLALQAERSDLTVERLSAGFSDRTVEIARYLQAALVEIRTELHRRAEREGIPRHEIDRAFRQALLDMLGRCWRQ
jgi:hypothetical protein